MTSIKVSRTKLITELEAAKARILSDAEKIAKEWEAYDKAVKEWTIKALKQADISQVRDRYGQRIEIEVPNSLPKPDQPNGMRPSERSWRNDFGKRSEHISLTEANQRKINEIDNTLKLLSLSNEESIPATAYKSVAQYL